MVGSFAEKFQQLQLSEDEKDVEEYRRLDEIMMQRFKEPLNMYNEGCISSFDLFIKLGYELSKRFPEG